jgi:hypothetical protein
MRLILAKIIWNFDIALENDSKDFIAMSTAYSLWEKPALNMRLKPVER